MSPEYQITDGLGNRRTIREGGSEKPDPRVEDIEDRVWREARRNCWCADNRKPCEYHEGFADGMDALLAHLESSGWRIVKLEQIGWVEARNDAGPVYRITEEKP